MPSPSSPPDERRERLEGKEAQAQYHAKLKDCKSARDRWSIWHRHRVFGFVLQEPGGFNAGKGGEHQNRPQVLSYDPFQLQYGNPNFIVPTPWSNLSMTIWGAPQHHVYSLVMVCVTLITAIFWQDSIEFEVALKIVTGASDALNRLTSYIIATFVGLLVTRWYQRRLYYIGLLGNCKALVVLVHGFLAVPHTEAEALGGRVGGAEQATHDARLTAASKARHSIARHIVLCFELAMLKQRGHMDSIVGKKYLEDQGLLIPESPEWSLMVPGARQLTVLSWISATIRKCQALGFLSEGIVTELSALITKARSNSSDMMDRTIYDLPFAYAHMVTLLTKLTILCNAVVLGTAHIIPGTQDEGFQFYEKYPHLLVMTLVFGVITYCGYQGLLDLHEHLHNPFGYRENDIPHETLCKSLKDLAFKLAKNADGADMALDGTWTVTSPSLTSPAESESGSLSATPSEGGVQMNPLNGS